MIFLWLDDDGIKSCDKMSVVVDGNEQMGKLALKMVLRNWIVHASHTHFAEGRNQWEVFHRKRISGLESVLVLRPFGPAIGKANTYENRIHAMPATAGADTENQLFVRNIRSSNISHFTSFGIASHFFCFFLSLSVHGIPMRDVRVTHIQLLYNFTRTHLSDFCVATTATIWLLVVPAAVRLFKK